MSTTTMALNCDGTDARTHRDRVLDWQQQAQATIDACLARGLTPSEAVRAASTSLRAGRRAQQLQRVDAQHAALVRDLEGVENPLASGPTDGMLHATLADIIANEVRRRWVRGGYLQWQVLGPGGRVVRTLRGRTVQTLLARGLVRVTTSADDPMPANRVVLVALATASRPDA